MKLNLLDSILDDYKDNRKNDEELPFDERLKLYKNKNYDLKKIDLETEITHILHLYHESSEKPLVSNLFNDTNIKDIKVIINHNRTLFGEGLQNYLIDFHNYRHLYNKKKNNILKNIQKNCKNLLNNELLFYNIEKRLKNIQSKENDILIFFREKDQNFQTLLDTVYFNIPYIDKFINNNELILNLSNLYRIFINPLTTIGGPIISIIVPYIFLYSFRIKIPFISYLKLLYKNFSSSGTFINILSSKFGSMAKYVSMFLSGLYVFFYLQSSYYSVKNSIDINKIINLLHTQINNFSYYIKNIEELYQFIKNSDKKFYFLKNINLDFSLINKLIEYPIFNQENKLFNNKGKILSTYNELSEISKKPFCNKVNCELKKILYFLAEIDLYCSLTNLHKKDGYNFCNYLSNNKPTIIAKNIWNPILGNKSIKNSINITDNILITGPNKAGKSTFIKSVIIAILLGQTFGLSNAETFKFTIFEGGIYSYMNSIDRVGHESTFEVEMNNASNYLKCLEHYENKKFTFIILDELFTSTNYIEGYSAAYAIIKKLCNYTSNLSLITTHYTGLSKLENITKKIKNYHFIINRIDDNNIHYTYKLKKGHSNIYIALELLKNSNFDKDIIKDAQEIAKSITFP